MIHPHFNVFNSKIEFLKSLIYYISAFFQYPRTIIKNTGCRTSDIPYFYLLPYSLERYHLAPALLRRVGRLRFRFGRGRFHEAADLLRRASLHIIGDVRIGVQGKPGAEVAQHTRQGLHIHAAGEGHRGERMTQIVGTHKLFNARLC